MVPLIRLRLSLRLSIADADISTDILLETEKITVPKMQKTNIMEKIRGMPLRFSLFWRSFFIRIPLICVGRRPGRHIMFLSFIIYGILKFFKRFPFGVIADGWM